MGAGNGAVSGGSVAVAGGGTPGVAAGTCGTGVACGGVPGVEPEAGPEACPGVDGGGGNGETAHAASIPTISPMATAWPTTPRRRFMGLILLEALGALVLLVLIVWWTMFSGRKKGELEQPADEVEEHKK